MTEVQRKSSETAEAAELLSGMPRAMRGRPRDSGTNIPLVAGPRSEFSSRVARVSAFLSQPVSTAFTTAAHWVREHRDARFGVHSEVAEAILERLTAEVGATQAMPKVLVIVAHPDDEAIGAGAVLRGLTDVTVVHVTDGAPNDDGYAQRRGFASREAYAQARRDEVVAALEVVGIPPARTRGLGFVDGEAAWHLVELCNQVADLIEELKPDVVLTHPYEGGHSDHDSTAFAVHLGAGIARRDGVASPVIMEMTSYHNYKGKRRLFDFLPFRGSVVKTVELSEEAKQVKRQMFDAFTSQHALLKTIPVEVERFRSAPRYLFTVPPHEGQLDYERLCRKLTGEEWRAQAERALATLRSKRQFTTA
jgi:N-acetylglucosamine malate deacetylase 2